jgi:hypothetical protein
MNRRACKLAIVSVALALMILGASQVIAQEAQRFPYWYVITHEVCPKNLDQYMATMAVMVENLKKHENANNWVTYQRTTGGPKQVFYYLLPMEKMGDIDDWTEPTQALAEVIGAEKAGETLVALGETTAAKFEVWGALDQLSHINPAATGIPAEGGMAMRVRVPPGRAFEFNQLLAKILAAYQAAGEGPFWDTSRCVIGAEGLLYSIALPFNTFAEMDEWAEVPEVMVAAHGEEGAAEIRAAWNQLAEVESFLVEMVPELSNPLVME